MIQKVLNFLKNTEDYISGEDISRHLKISRAAICKYVHQLKELGYDIVAVPHLGYHLIRTPDRLFPEEILYNLDTKFIGKNIYYFETVTSTMDIANQLILKDTPEGTLVVAESQTEGRGRLGRSWFSPKYKGIYVSLILKPSIFPNQAGLLTFLCAVSVVEAINELTSLDTKIKWPNDIILSQKKLGGILLELSAEMDRIHYAIVGIGINVNNTKKDLITGATSLKEEKAQHIDRVRLLQEILRRIEFNYLEFKNDKGSYLLRRWRMFNDSLNRRIKIISKHQIWEGVAVDVDTDGALLLREDSGI
ncbi:MAG: biotin--[acetyl-CoA-carboxylase] ligase, partial [Candidatus Omnitrophica bacterium]|nr:biotin--[acetyl-CoA-carboxylase] ligase [Candidatus Omnitrophota bacterium]